MIGLVNNKIRSDTNIEKMSSKEHDDVQRIGRKLEKIISRKDSSVQVAPHQCRPF